MNLRGLISMNEFYGLSEKIAILIDDYLNTNMEDLSNINDLIERRNPSSLSQARTRECRSKWGK